MLKDLDEVINLPVVRDFENLVKDLGSDFDEKEVAHRMFVENKNLWTEITLVIFKDYRKPYGWENVITKKVETDEPVADGVALITAVRSNKELLEFLKKFDTADHSALGAVVSDCKPIWDDRVVKESSADCYIMYHNAFRRARMFSVVADKNIVKVKEKIV